MKLSLEKIFQWASSILTLLCIAFVVYKSTECLMKYFKNLESSNVSIEDAAKHDYPAISICLNDPDSFHEETLKKCNLTLDDYKHSHIWVGDGSEDFCKDPLKLYEEMTKDPFNSIITDVVMVGMNYDSFNPTTYVTKDSKWNGRCYEFEVPKDTKITFMVFWLSKDALVYIHSPGSFHGANYKEFAVLLGKQIEIDVMHEVFEVLDFDQQQCETYPDGRDKCIDEKVYELSMEQLGCTSPYGTNKSNICTSTETSSKAYTIFDDLTLYNMTEANKHCPRSCTYQILSFSRFLRDDSDDQYQGYLYLRFENFIKVSRTHLAYGWLELVAEVGGYVGLFLGVSINQTLSRMRQVFGFFARK